MMPNGQLLHASSRYACDNWPLDVSRHSMQLTQPSTSVPSNAIWRNRM